MSSSLTKEQKNEIRKSLPLKIFEQRKNAADIEYNILHHRNLLYDLMRIEIKPGFGQHLEFSGLDLRGESVSVFVNLNPDSFKKFRDNMIELCRSNIKRRKCELAAIPNAKIIPFDFRKKEVEPGRQPQPNPPPPKKEPETILKGGWEVSKAAGIYCSEIKSFVEEKGLPAFKIPGRKFWFAFPEEIEK